MFRLTELLPQRRARPKGPLPYDMFDRGRTEQEVAQARRLERIYHKGQGRIWDGKQLLAELVARHGAPKLDPERAEAVRTLFAVILWGELAAWKVSAELALVLEPLEAKLAATSQAHDEARHFYVMHDYLELLDYEPGALPPVAARTLEEVLGADTLVKKLIGMQLMVEPIALTIFQLTRERRLEPVLAELLTFYERDEARHVALGINHLPVLMRGLGRREAFDLAIWQLRMLELQLAGMAELAPAFQALGFEPNDVLRLGMAKQLIAFRAMEREIGHPGQVEWFKRWFDFRIEMAWPKGADVRPDLPHRLFRAAELVYRGIAETETSLGAEPA